MKPKNTAYISVGSNINPVANIRKAFSLLNSKVLALRSAPFYWSKALDRPDQNDYLNSVWTFQTNLDPLSLKAHILRRVETICKRQRTHDKYAARTIDLDLILFNNLVCRSPELTLPDPDIYIRDFIARPLCDLNPDLTLPDTSQPIKAIAAQWEHAASRAQAHAGTDILEGVSVDLSVEGEDENLSGWF